MSSNDSKRVPLILSNKWRGHGVDCMYLFSGTRKIQAHRLVLSSVSDYFSAMFTSNVREANQQEIVLKDVDPASLEDLVQYCYTG